jgi:hypothetical protein
VGKESVKSSAGQAWAIPDSLKMRGFVSEVAAACVEIREIRPEATTAVVKAAF